MKTSTSPSSSSSSSSSLLSNPAQFLLFGLLLTTFYTLNLQSTINKNDSNTANIGPLTSDSDRFNYNNTFGEMSTSTRSSATRTRSGSKCITFDETMDDLIASSSMVFVMGPAKAALTTMKYFTEKCTGLFSTNMLDQSLNGVVFDYVPMPDHYLLVDRIINGIDNRFNDRGGVNGRDRVNVPDQLLSSHAYSDKLLIDLMESLPRDALIIYSYREETERLLSAIHWILEHNCRSKRTQQNVTPKMRNGTHCVYDEMYVVGDVVEPRVYEIGRGAPEIMTCDFYDAIERNFPNMVFMNFKQVGNLQKAIAKHQCPEFLEQEPLHKNAARNETTILLQLEKDGRMVTLEEWLQKKRAVLVWRLNLKGRGQQCQRKTRKMEDELLFECPDQLLQVKRDTSF